MSIEQGRLSGRPTTISALQLAEAVRAGENGARDAVDNRPAAHATQPSPTELSLLARVSELQLAIREEATARLAAIRAEVMAAREAFSPVRAEGDVRGVEAKMRGLIARQGAALQRLVHDALKAKRDYEYFNYVNKRTTDPRPDAWQFVLAFLMVPLALESLLNGSFFADASEFGLVGGAATAVIISALNIALGFTLGVGPARYCGHARASHLFWALPAFLLMIALILGFNLAVGHYRELLIANPDLASQKVLPRLMAEPLAIFELKSLALVLIGCLVALASAYKGYTAFGTYPGQAKAWRRWRQAADAVEAERGRVDVDLGAELEALRADLGALGERSRGAIARLVSARAQAEQARETYRTRLDQLKLAKDSALMEYREANLQVRTELAPAYFSQTLNLPQVDQPETLDDYRRLAALIAESEREFADLPARIEVKLRDQVALLRGLDLFGEIERMKAGALAAGRRDFEEEDAARRQGAAAFGTADGQA